MCRAVSILAFAFGILALAYAATAGEPTAAEFLREKKAVFAQERKKIWQRINWERDPKKALARAQSTRKPILVFLYVKNFLSPTTKDSC